MTGATQINVMMIGTRVLTESSAEAQNLCKKSWFGTLRADGRVELSGFEALYLAHAERISVQDARGRRIGVDALERRLLGRSRISWVRYVVFADMRKRGYIVKTALKFGADFRVYDRGAMPGKDHARWVLYPAHERDSLTWHSFAAKSRVAHSTRKQLLIAVVDDEGDITYWDAAWRRP